jgi:hypothetical protein
VQTTPCLSRARLRHPPSSTRLANALAIRVNCTRLGLAFGEVPLKPPHRRLLVLRRLALGVGWTSLDGVRTDLMGYLTLAFPIGL